MNSSITNKIANQLEENRNDVSEVFEHKKVFSKVQNSNLYDKIGCFLGATAQICKNPQNLVHAFNVFAIVFVWKEQF